MLMTHTGPVSSTSLREQVLNLQQRLARLPMPVLDLVFRFGVAAVFWKSGMTKIANWDLTIALFANEYPLPLLSPEIAALLATVAELSCPILLVLGLGARFGAAALLVMTAVIQFFVYPGNWAEHLLWASIFTYIISRGPGALSIDHLLARAFLRRGQP